MIIDQLPNISTPLQNTDEMAIERGTNTYKINYNALATATIEKLGDPVTVTHGGTNAATAAGARTNLEVYSKAETDGAIAALMPNAMVRGESNKRYLKISKGAAQGSGLFGSICIVAHDRVLIARILSDGITELLTSTNKLAYTVDTTNHEIIFDGISIYANWLVIVGGGNATKYTYTFYNP